jgi:oligoendopeptidase F
MTSQSQDKAATAAAPEAALGPLPEWDLSDLYPGRDSAELKRDLARTEADAGAFRERYEGKLQSLSGAALGAAIATYERLQETLGRIMSYAYLVYAGNMEDAEIGRFFQNMQEKVNAISTVLLFFTLELNRIEDRDLEQKLGAAELAHYAPWLRDTRAFRPHQLSDELEKMLHEKYVAGRAAWTRLFDETMAALRFSIDGQELTSAEALHLLSEPDPEKRKRAAKALGEVFGRNVRLFALITNTLAKDKEIEDRWRKFARPISSRNLGNFVEDEVVDALIAAVRSAFPALSHRYYRLKAKWFGVERLPYWDRNAPLPKQDDKIVPWPEAQRLVLGAYAAFSPELAAIGRRFFEQRWIDAPVRPGKSPGAFAHPTVPSAHPYLLLNYLGKTRDVMTLAHELGHGVHQVLAGPQGQLMADTPLTLAETASVFGEMLTFRAILAAESDPKRRKVMLAAKVEDMLNTVVRQIAFVEFERRVHDERRDGELTPDRIGEIWMAVQSESLGPAIGFEDEYRHYWTYIPHFIHTPFYVYAYAFGDCLVNSLYAVYQGAAPGFAEKYLAMLRAGGSKRHKELLAPFGLDASDPSFWQKGLSVIAGFIDELERMS